MEWLVALLAFVSMVSGNIERNEDYVAAEIKSITGIEVQEHRYALRSIDGKRSRIGVDTIWLARPRPQEFRHELVHVWLRHHIEYSPAYEEAIAEYIGNRLGDYDHPLQRLQEYSLTPLVCAIHMPRYGVEIDGIYGGDNAWYAYVTWELVVKQYALAKDDVSLSEFSEPIHVAYWLEAYRAVCR
jgi:hypothetical protein